MSGLSVSGGAGGITASCDDITALARLFGGTAGELAAEAAGLAAVLGHPRLLESNVLDPVGGARAGWELARSGAAVTALAGRCVAVQATLRAAALSYQGADQLQALARDRIGPVLELPVAAGRAVSAGRGGARAGLEQFLTADAGLTDLVLDAAPGGPGGFTRALTPLYSDGRPIVSDLARADGAPPRSLTDLVRNLARRDEGQPGEIDVQILSRSAGRRSVIVDIPGTKDWSPALRQADITSVATNLRALTGGTTSYELGVLAALRRAGVTAADEVLLVGHSQGGMVALDVASRPSEFRITHVITAGAPIGLSAAGVPPAVQVLALENRSDVVAHLDGRSNPDRPNVLTVGFRVDHGDILANHGLVESYLRGAATTDRCSDPSVRSYLTGLRPFLEGETAETHRFLITRTYG